VAPACVAWRDDHQWLWAMRHQWGRRFTTEAENVAELAALLALVRMTSRCLIADVIRGKPWNAAMPRYRNAALIIPSRWRWP
jgi:hypothetical protein